MSVAPVLEFIAREHPAFVHAPLGLIVALPVAMLGSFFPKRSLRWVRTAFFIASLALASSLVALISGLLWGRQIALIPADGYVPKVASASQVLQRMLQLHEIAALTGVVVGSLCVWLIWRVWHPAQVNMESTSIHHRKQLGRRIWERGVGAPALILCLLWLATWAFCGRLGGIMVFGNAATNKAAAETEAKRKSDAEAELPIRALDYASLEPAMEKPVRSAPHSNRWVRVWVTASGIDAYKAGKQLPPGAYAVMSTHEDLRGRPSFEPGPLYFRETRADGTPYVAFYWPRVPEAQRSETGGEDSVYYRSPDPRLQSCIDCHRKQ